ncbi:MAG: ribonuclease R [Synechococcales cyanobacterium]
MDKGTVVEFTHRNEPHLALVQGMDGKKNLVLVTAAGQSYSVHPRQITFHTWDPQIQRPQDLQEFSAQAQARRDPESIALAWELVHEERKVFTLEELAELLCGDASPSSLYGAHQLLSQDQVFFKGKMDRDVFGYEPRTPSQVEEIQHRLTVTAQRQHEQEQFEARLIAVHQGSLPPEEWPQDWARGWTEAERRRLECLERFALHGDNATDRPQAVKLLSLLKQPATPAAALHSLIRLGIWDVHENLYIRRSGLSVDFPADLDALVQERQLQPPPDPCPRRDLTHLHTYTIDDASTEEIDDGLSLESLDNGQHRLWIHIADPSRWVTMGDPLDREARKRGTTVYLPETIIPMFPATLATGPMSLVQGQVRTALSFGVQLAEDGALAQFDIVPSLIRVTYRLTYEDADEMLELNAEQALTEIAQAAQSRYRWRISQGAIPIELPECQIEVTDGIPTLTAVEDTPSRQMVAEMMILCGEVAARYASEHGIPVSYRVQPQPELPADLEQMPKGWIRAWALVRCMSKAEIGLTPGRHAGLGLSAYCQVTSPIRRYSDLVAHFQLKAYLAQQPFPFTAAEVQHIIQGLDVSLSEATQVERKTERYWATEFFRQQGDRVWRAQVIGILRDWENLAMVIIDDLAFRTGVRFQRHVTVGEWVHLTVRVANPREEVLEFDEVTRQAPEALTTEP